jgi:hypothetical protein
LAATHSLAPVVNLASDDEDIKPMVKKNGGGSGRYGSGGCYGDDISY